MANSKKHRVAAQRAQGLEPEFTAQPRSIPDELALEASGEPELSVDADELGSRFLRDAIEQGDFDPERNWPGDASLTEGPARDQPLSGINFVAGNKVWEQTVDIESRTHGAADLLREPAPPLAADDFDEEFDDEDDIDPDGFDARAEELSRVADSGVQEFSLFDRPGEDGDATPAPNIQLDEQGSHTRMAARQNLGQEVPKSKAIPQDATRPESGKRERREPLFGRLLHAALVLCSRVLRSVANRLHQHP